MTEFALVQTSPKHALATLLSWSNVAVPTSLVRLQLVQQAVLHL
jgi:hypothetical protein